MSERDVGQLHSADDLIAAVEQYGFLPFFRNEIHGFSIEELCPPELWLRMMWTVRGNGRVRLRGAANVSTANFSTRRLAL
nr:hypothetical protein [Faecalibacterium prausnitzii]